MTHGSLFSGIGGFDLAAEWMGWQNIFHCEWNPFGQKVLKHYWPQSISYNDITKTDFTIHAGAIDVLTGGFPCQPYSTAGKRLGKEDERHLWPEMLRAIREISPSYVVGENVRGLTNWNGGMVFDEVQADLEAAGYEVLPFLLPAAGVNAPHRRDRIWFVAHATRFSRINGTRNDKHESQTIQGKRFNEPVFTPNSESIGKRSRAEEQRQDEGSWQQLEGTEPWSNGNNNGESRIIANTECNGVQQNETAALCNRNRNNKEQTHFGENFTSRIGTAVEQFDWTEWPTQSPILSGNDGLPTKLDGITFSKWRNESIKAYGNAIVPQVAYQIFKAIQQMEEL